LSISIEGKWPPVPDPKKPHFALPPIVALADFLSVPLEMPPVIVEGMIRERSVVQFSSSSKSYKTWTLLDLGLSVSQGCSWLGRQVAQGRVLFLNFELTEAELQSRLKAISGSKGTNLGNALFDVCNLRGHSRDIGVMMPEIIRYCQGKDYSMIIPDPIYSMMGERNENAANEMADFLNHLSELSEATGAAVVYTHHFAKGMASSKEQIDRASGSGVFARHADGIITLTRHEEDSAFVVEAELRSFSRPAPFTVKWDYPRMEVVDLDPRRLKRKAGASTKYTVGGIVDCLTDGMTTGEWAAAAANTVGICTATFHVYRQQAEAKKYAEKRDKQWFRMAKVVKFVAAPPEPRISDTIVGAAA
jgi:RecA-family ATPase